MWNCRLSFSLQGQHFGLEEDDSLLVDGTLLGLTYTLWIQGLPWLLLGIAMGLGLYDAAFGALGHILHGFHVLRDHAHRRCRRTSIVAGVMPAVEKRCA